VTPARRRLAWAVVFGAGVVLRLALSSGYGLGDDPNYFACYHGIFRTGTYNPNDAYAMRFGLWVPVVAFMKVFGVTEVGWIGAITFCSFVNLALVYLLARQEWEWPYPLVAMALFAVFPLDVLCSTLFANDEIVATYCFTAFWLYRDALLRDRARGIRTVCAALAGVFLLFGFVSKPWVALMAPLFAIEALRHWRRGWPYTLVTAGVTVVLVGGYVTWQWVRFGDPLWHVDVARPVAIFLPYTRDILLDYPRMLFFRNDYGSWFAGFYPHLLLLLAVLFPFPTFRAGKWLAFFAVMLLGLAAMPAGRDKDGQWTTLVPHIFRYLAFVSIPLCLALAAYVREVFRWRRWAGPTLLAGVVVLGVVQSVAVTAPSRDAFGEERRANAVLRQFTDETIWSDWDLLARFQNFAPAGKRAQVTHALRSETSEGRAQEFAAISEGVVVTGGGRLPWYGCYRCTADLAGFPVPASWTLLETFEGRPLTQYRHEPLRIWRVSQAAARAKEMLAERTDPEAKRALLREVAGRGDNALAAEIGRRILEETPDDAEVASLTGMACAKSEKSGCAERYLTQSLDHGLPPDRARQAVVYLALSASRQQAFERARHWIDEYRQRFPGAPMDAQLEEIATGLPEAVERFHAGDLAAARRLLETIASRTDVSPDRRQRARYFLTLTLFRAGAIRDGIEQAAAYRTAYGEDPSWVELHYREGEAQVVRNPRAARDVFADVAQRYPGTFWAAQAQRQLSTLPPSS